MKLTAAVCPCCAASIEIPEGKDRCFCVHCGSQILVEAAVAFARVKIEGTVQVKSVDFIIEAGRLVEYRGESASPIIPDNVHAIGEGAFAGKLIKSVVIPESVVEIEQGAFEGCSRLESIMVPQSVRAIGDSAFRACASLRTIDVRAPVERIGLWVFAECSSLEEIAIPDTVKTIGGSAFKSCTALARVKLPASLSQIGFEAFKGCSSLSEVIGYDGRWPKAFEDSPFRASQRKVRLPFAR